MPNFISIVIALTVMMGSGHAQTTLEQDIQQLERMSNTFAAVSARVQAGVVAVSTERTVASSSPFRGLPFDDPVFRRFFRVPQRKRRTQGLGSGVIISSDGYVLTNNHVVEGADRISIDLTDGRTFQAEIVGRDEKSDVAVLKVNADVKLPTVPIGNSDSLKVGQWVLAIGNPFGLQHTVTYGIVSAMGRGDVGIADIEDFIQTDAAINPGNSGGALVNLRGELVGINTAILSKSGGYQGIGFAIPVNLATRIKNQLIEHGEVAAGYLGINYQTLTTDMADALAVGTTSGVLIDTVHPESPADNAGLLRGDVIVAIDGAKVKDESDYRKRIGLAGPDKRIRIDIWRGSKKKTVRTTLEASETTAGMLSDRSELLGWELQEITAELARRYGYRPGAALIVTDLIPGKPAERSGLRRGDFIIEINRNRVGTFEGLRDILTVIDPGDPMLLLVRRGRRTFFTTVRMPKG
jgi:serine protease Do